MRFGIRGLIILLIAGFCGSAVAQDWNNRARSDMARGNLDAAESNLRQALEVNPFDPVALNNLAVAKAEQGDYHSSLDLLERAYELAPNHPDIQLNLTRMRGWVMTYAGNETRSKSNDWGRTGLPPSPPPAWR